MTDVEKLTRKTVEEGGVLAMLYFDIHAKTKELVKELGTGFINGIIQKPGVVFALGEINDPEGGEEGKNWSSIIEIKILTRNFQTLGNICMAHSPFTVEILRPDEITLKLSDAHALLSIMSAITAEYKRHILTKLSKPADLSKIEDTLSRRAKMGENILKRKKGED